MNYPYHEILIEEGDNPIELLYFDIRSIKIRDENDHNVRLVLRHKTSSGDVEIETNNLSKYMSFFRQCKCKCSLVVYSEKKCKIIINF